jgi:hypothetical protein
LNICSRETKRARHAVITFYLLSRQGAKGLILRSEMFPLRLCEIKK